MAYLGRIETGTSKTGAISPVGDFDTYNTTFIAGLTYSASAKGASSHSGSLVDPNIALYDASGTRLLFNDDVTPGSSRDGQITFTIGAGGTAVYTLGVGEQGNNATGSYTLTVSAGYASNNADSVTGTNANDAIHGMAGNDILYGMGGNDNLIGGTGNDTLLGGDLGDVLQGQAGNDMLRGQSGNDILYGALGADTLVGGAGADTFRFLSNSDSNSRFGVDVITGGDGAVAFEGVGLRGGDVIDLHGIDANLTIAGNQDFVFSASRAAGTCSLSEVNGETVLNAHLNNDGVADLTIRIADGAISAYDYTSDEFIL